MPDTLKNYQDTLTLRARANRRIEKAEQELRDANQEHEAANALVTDAGIKVRAELGVGNYKLKGNQVLVVSSTTVQIQELRSL